MRKLLWALTGLLIKAGTQSNTVATLFESLTGPATKASFEPDTNGSCKNHTTRSLNFTLGASFPTQLVG